MLTPRMQAILWRVGHCVIVALLILFVAYLFPTVAAFLAIHYVWPLILLVMAIYVLVPLMGRVGTP